jgi:iron complex outermembrane recepter protein
MRIGFLLLLLMVVLYRLSAQDRTITGTVTDADTKQPLTYCSVFTLHTTIGTSTDMKGNFKLIIPSSTLSPKLVIAFLGYKTDTITLVESQRNYPIFLNPTQSSLNEVVVTGVTRTTLIRENPVSIISISPKAIEQTTESNIIDVLVKNTPGLNAVKTGPNISKPYIRGLGYNRVLTLYDGVRQEGQQWGDEHGIEVDAYNIYRAEVIKGPASLMFGSDAVAGVVSLIPYMSMDTDKIIHGKSFSEYQTNNGLIGNGFQLNYGSPHWSYALRGSYRIAKNYSNSIDGRVYNTGFQETNLSSGIQHTSTKGFSTLNLTLYDNLQGIPDGSRDSLTRKFTEQIYEGSMDNIKNRPVVSNDELNSYQLSPLHQHIQHYRIYSNNHYEIGKGDIDFLLGFQQNIRREFDHPTAPQQAGMFVRLNTLNYGVRYNAPKIINTEMSIGINGMYQNNISENATDFPIPDYNLFDAGAYWYAKWSYKRWTVSGGIRSDIRYLQGNNFYTKKDSATGFDKQVSDTAGAYLQFPAFKKMFKGTSMSIGTTYQLSEHFNMKVNIARGYRAPNITELASNGLDPGAHIIYLGNRNSVPEFSTQEDIGVDMDFNSVSASLSVFNNNIDHYIYLSQLTDANGNPIINPQGNKTYQYQQASAQLYGTEASLFIHPEFLKGFSFNNSFSVIYGYNRNAAYKDKGVYGEYLPLIPPLKLLSSFNQDIKIKSRIISLIGLKAEIDYNAEQDRFLALNKTETMTPSYTLFNVGINSTINYTKKSVLHFQIQVNNIFDKAYQSNLSRLKYFEYYSASPNGHLGIYGMGRNICFRLIIPF